MGLKSLESRLERLRARLQPARSQDTSGFDESQLNDAERAEFDRLVRRQSKDQWKTPLTSREAELAARVQFVFTHAGRVTRWTFDQFAEVARELERNI